MRVITFVFTIAKATAFFLVILLVYWSVIETTTKDFVIRFIV